MSCQTYIIDVNQQFILLYEMCNLQIKRFLHRSILKSRDILDECENSVFSPSGMQRSMGIRHEISHTRGRCADLQF